MKFLNSGVGSLHFFAAITALNFGLWQKDINAGCTLFTFMIFVTWVAYHHSMKNWWPQ